MMMVASTAATRLHEKVPSAWTSSGRLAANMCAASRRLIFCAFSPSPSFAGR